MITAIITIDGKAYKGVDIDAMYTTNIGGNGLHDTGRHELENLIIEDGTPKDIQGIFNLRSEMERILKRIRDKQIQPKQIIITFE